MKAIFSHITSLIKGLYSWPSQKKIEKIASDSIARHQDTLIKLEKYDKGEIKKPAKLAQYSSLQDYLRDLQKRTRAISSHGGTSPSI